MKNYQDYVDYFENLVIQFNGIDHDPENGKEGFFRINLEELASGTGTTVDADGFFFVLTNYTWKPVQGDDDSYIKKGEGMFFVMGTVDQGDFDDQTRVLAETEKIVEKFMNRIHLDSRKEIHDENSIWYGQQDTMKFENAVPLQGPGNANHYGWQVVFEFSAYWNPCVELDDWADKSTPDDVNPNI